MFAQLAALKADIDFNAYWRRTGKILAEMDEEMYKDQLRAEGELKKTQEILVLADQVSSLEELKQKLAGLN